jgi:hypothetical protein
LSHPLCPALTVLPLPVTMVESTFAALLMPAIGTAALLEPGPIAAGNAAITLPAITVRAHKKDRVASAAQANPLPQNHFAMNRHARSQAGLDNGDSFVAAWNQFGCGGLTKVAIQEPCRLRRRGSLLLPAFDVTIYLAGIR